MTKISVVICTFNRVSLLELALKSLLNQSVTPYEVIIVDNKSTDGTEDLVQSYFSSFSRLRYFFEENVGLSHARNRGIRESKGDYIAFIDDDCIVPVDWLKNAYKLIKENKCEIFGGAIFPYYLEKKPKWFKNEYVLYSHGDKPRYLKNLETLFGGNVVFKKVIFEKIGFFRNDLGMIGNVLLYGEETELQLRYLNHFEGCWLFYEPSFYLKHYVRPEKMTLIWNIKSFIGRGKSRYYKESKSKISNITLILNLIITSLKIIFLGTFGVLFRSRKMYTFPQNFVMERMQGNFKKIGYLLENIKNSKT